MIVGRRFEFRNFSLERGERRKERREKREEERRGLETEGRRVGRRLEFRNAMQMCSKGMGPCQIPITL